MIDFQNASFLKLRDVSNSSFSGILSPILIYDEAIVSSYQGVRDGVVFTNKRIITINVQGISGKKKDLTSLPYSKIQSYSIETSGTFDMDSELILWFSSLGVVRLEFMLGSNIMEICKLISENVL